MPSLYRRLLGDDFDRLPPALRDFHDVERERHFRAVFRITRGRGWVRGLLCRLGRLPPAGAEVPLRLRVVPEGERERWVRDFGGHRMESVQWAAGGLMHESLGAVRLAFRLTVDGTALRLEAVRAWVLGVRWPMALAPRGSGVEVGGADGCAIVARAEAPLLGLLIRYEGLVVPDPSPGCDGPEKNSWDQPLDRPGRRTLPSPNLLV
jgi:hypothetical protein